MKRVLFTVFMLNVVCLLTSLAQDNTKVGLPEGAIARLGKGGINLMRFSPDGTRLAVGTDVGVWVYDVPDGKETALFTEHPGQINALAFSTDGKVLASGGFNNPIIQLWDLDTDSQRSTLTLPEEIQSISMLTFAKDDRILISLDQSGNINYWHVDTHQKVLDIVTEPLSYNAVAVSTDGSTFATGDKHGTIRLWNATTEHQFEDPGDNPQDQDILALAFSSDRKTLASGGEDKTVRLWDTEKHAHATLKGHEASVTAVAFAPDGKILATGDIGKVIKLWDVNTRRERSTLTGHTNGISALTFTPDGKTLASGSYDGTIRFWNPDTGQELLTFTTGHTEWIKAVAFAENGITLATAAFTGVVEVWNLKTAQELTTFTKAKNDLTGPVAFSHDATRCASRGGSGTIVFGSLGSGYHARGPGRGNIELWDITTGEQIPGLWQDIEGDANALALAFSPDNKILAAGIPRQGIRAWDINTGAELFNLNAAEPFGRKLVFSHDGKTLATNGTHVQTRVWNISTQRDITPPNIMNASALAFSPDGKTLAYGHPNGIVLSGITAAGIKERGRIPTHRGFGSVLTFSPDGKILLDTKSIGLPPLIQLWDVETGTDLGTLSGHTGNIEMLVFSHDGKMLASGSWDGTVLLWDWDKISAKIATDNMGKEFRNNLEPPEAQIEYTGKAEEAEAVLNWLKKHNYRVNKHGDTYTLTGKGSASTSGGGTMSSGDVNIKIDKYGILRIRVQGVGSAPFTLDEEDNLQFHSLPDLD